MNEVQSTGNPVQQCAQIAENKDAVVEVESYFLYENPGEIERGEQDDGKQESEDQLFVHATEDGVRP